MTASVVFAVVAICSSLVAAVVTRPLLRLGRFRAVNWRGAAIPRGYGISLPLAEGVAALLWWVCGNDISRLVIPLLGLFGMAGVGLMDDLSREPAGGGFRGHARVLLQERRVAVGLLKAILGGPICFAVGFGLAGVGGPGNHALVGVLNGLLLALLANGVNLLDVRPGRAGKAAFGGYLVALAAVPTSAMRYLPVMLASVLFLPADCKGRAMMGDTGAYPLGFALGLALLPLSSAPKAAICCVLVCFHLYCEVKSVTAAIERSRILKWMDSLWVEK